MYLQVLQQGQVDTTTQASNKAHLHFIDVLRETLQILRPLAPIKTTPVDTTKSEAEKDNDVAADLRNQFEYLEVDEPTEWTSRNLPKAKALASADTCELEATDEDISFAIFCLLKDMTDIRHYVRQTWAEYREHQIAFTIAALTMNTAMAIFRRLNEEFIAEFPDFDDHGAIIQFLYDGYCDPNTDEKTSVEFGAYTASTFKLSSKIFFCDHTYEVLREFVMASELPFYQQDQDSGLRLTSDEQVLFKCCSLFGLLAKQTDCALYNDQLIQGFRILKTNNSEETIHAWIVFALQLFIDTRRVVGDTELSRCLNEAQQLQEWMSAALQQSLKFGETNTVNDYYKINANALKGVRKQIDVALKKDFMQCVLNDYFGACDMIERATRYNWGLFFLFRNNPMVLGLITNHFLEELHEIGIGLCGDQASVITSIHLYNAAQQSGRVPKSVEWVDLEKVIEWQSPTWIFVGDRPENPGDCFRHYKMVMGISATVLSRDRNGKSTLRLKKTATTTTLPISQKKNRKLKLMSTYVDLMNEAPNQNNQPRGGRNGNVRWIRTRAATEPLVMIEMLVAKYLENETPSLVSGIQNKSSSTHLRVPPLSMISIFKDYLKSEEKIFRFDLLALNQRCVELLRKIQKVCVEQSPLDYPADKYGGDRHANSCFSHMMAGELGLERCQPTRFQEACLLVKDVIENVGDEEFEKSESRCFIKGDGTKVVTDSFSTPIEDVVMFYERAKTRAIILVDGPPGSEITIV
ncbi:uncharacterized protein PAC_11814 [Phialocephala subalpina]|uniref:DUF6604 domain-containing protein n=1 Tax=Phialocephala subalpina TaxID=576137 RepID=A0A1L7XAC0_9HELO|nr:uncharacterized protein PAC_11814 [Phialocephala subalpina]